ncbi:MAG: RDD family protein [Pseudomonadota bacterium]|nr:RDD family protein [Pseudomonadota bacterium]
MIINREVYGFLFFGALVLTATILSVTPTIDISCGKSCGFAVSNPPVFVLGGLIIGAMTIFIPRVAPEHRPDAKVNLWRQIVAFLIDAHVGLFLGLATAHVFLHTGLLAIQGTWDWGAFSGSESTAAIFNLISGAIGLATLYSYFWLPIRSGGATVGEYMMGYQIDEQWDKRASPWRPLLLFIGVGSFPFWMLFLTSRFVTTNTFWWDEVSNVKPVMVSK